MSDEYLNPVDVKDSHVLTRIVERRAKESDVYNVPFAPIRQTMSRKVKLRVKHVDGSGLAAFKADNALTPVVGGGGDVQDIYLELFTIAEKHVLTASDILALESPDPVIAAGAARNIVELGKQLRIRNVNRTKWMAWMAVRDQLTVTYPDGVSIAIDYDLDGTDQNSYFSGSHLPTASVAWSNAAADIIEDVYTWTKLIADDLGVDQSECIMYVNSSTWRYMKKNTGIKAELSASNPRIITPRMAEVVEILEIAEIRMMNEYYTDESDVKHKFLPDGYVLITAPDQVNGTPLIDMLDGPVVRVVNGDLVVAQNPGALSEIYVNEEQLTKNLRVQTARLPVMNYPNGIVWADIAP